ncbi:unnamed protein product [Acanthoscelides obtectus]|uniref:YqgF/RNase H-like domain-containing protein n=1 Tax=Acanthoscelides obtectus TaxID=200917 RepID=A0A9P0LLB5_ACAOB|nr:unnamed protein product [Acanthoscelides obtectus]CAK1624494.1 S1 RNA-binding domain-containing protein 1 [Acanthoscelides obtectus]
MSLEEPGFNSTTIQVRNFIREQFDERIISLNGSIYWPPDVSPLDFYLWDHTKNEERKASSTETLLLRKRKATTKASTSKEESDADYDAPANKKKKTTSKKKSEVQMEISTKKKKAVNKKIKSEALNSKVKTEPSTSLAVGKENVYIKDELYADVKPVKFEYLKTKSETDDRILEPFWRDHDLLAEQKSLSPNIAKNVIKLLEEGNTVPFIARYRRDATGNMGPEMLQEVKSIFEEICVLKQKIKTSVKGLIKQEYCHDQVLRAVKSCRSLDELEITYAPYKQDRKGTLAERAKELGLEEPALKLLQNTGVVNLQRYVTKDHDIKEIESGIVHIIAYNIAVDSEMLTYIRELRYKERIVLESKKSKTKQTVRSTDKNFQKLPIKNADESKFETYFDFQIPVRYAKPYQVLAINRGEKLKFLAVKIAIPESLFIKFQQFCYRKWIKQGPYNELRNNLLNEAIKDSYNRLVKPLITREIRTELKNKADKASYDVFSENLKHLLKEPPLKGQVILGIDPGFVGGCKMAVISQTGLVLNYNVIYPHGKFSDQETAGKVLRDMLLEHSCSLIALGNGKASRETEEFICDMIRHKYFYPLDVKYVIVSEDGASVYSCSPEAKKEFPNLDTNIISAVSLARRLQDPLSELVKIEPHHLGIGMYQHDLKKKSIEEALKEVVSECVSFIGVDLNTASHSLLRYLLSYS